MGDDLIDGGAGVDTTSYAHSVGAVTASLLTGKAKGDGKFPKAQVFETGTNQWRTFDAWPPKNVETRTLYLSDKGKLLLQAPSTGSAYDEFLSNPARPVPAINLARLSKGKMIGVRYNQNRSWVGGTVAFIQGKT